MMSEPFYGTSNWSSRRHVRKLLSESMRQISHESEQLQQMQPVITDTVSHDVAQSSEACARSCSMPMEVHSCRNESDCSTGCNDASSSCHTELEDVIEVASTASTIAQDLSGWALKHNVSHSAVKDLLAILRKNHPGLPVDPRTLLNTPQNLICRKLADGGEYFNFGISSGPQHFDLHSPIKLQFNFDGLPLFESSGKELWPIMGLVKGTLCERFVVGLYCGVGKPVFGRIRERVCV